MLHKVLLLVLALVAPLLATNTAGDPTDLSNWPPCAQKCIPTGLGPPSDCGSLSNLTCICRQPAFSETIATCEQLSCSQQEFTDIRTLSKKLCAPVGGVGPAVSSVGSTAIATQPTTLSSTPTLPPTATNPSQVSSVLATATLSPNLGNPADLSSYPPCAQICNNETVIVIKRTTNPSFSQASIQDSCGPYFRSLTAGCEAATCSEKEYTATQLLAKQLCGSLYVSNATLASAVTSAVTSATAAAKAATVGKDPADINALPECAANCIKQINYGGCGSLSNRECICQGIAFNDAIGPCETANCSTTDLEATAFLAEVLCEPVGGILTKPVNYTNSTTGGGNGTVGSPSPSPSAFTGDGTRFGREVEGMIVGAMAVGLGVMML